MLSNANQCMKCRYIEKLQKTEKKYEKTGTRDLYMLTRVCQRFQFSRFISLLDESKIVFTFAQVFSFFLWPPGFMFLESIFKLLYLVIRE